MREFSDPSDEPDDLSDASNSGDLMPLEYGGGVSEQDYEGAYELPLDRWDTPGLAPLRRSDESRDEVRYNRPRGGVPPLVPDDGVEIGDRRETEPPHRGVRASVGSLAERPASEWAARLDALTTCIAAVSGTPGEWQEREVGGKLSAEELHELVRGEQAATLDVYRLVDGKLIAVVPSEREDGQPGQAAIIFRRIFVAAGKEALTSVATGLIDVWIGVPVVSLLNLPRDFAGAVFYAVGLSALRSELATG